MLKGYITYIGAAGFALVAVFHLIQGDTQQAVEFALLALTAAGLRRAIQ